MALNTALSFSADMGKGVNMGMEVVAGAGAGAGVDIGHLFARAWRIW